MTETRGRRRNVAALPAKRQGCGEFAFFAVLAVRRRACAARPDAAGSRFAYFPPASATSGFEAAHGGPFQPLDKAARQG